MNNDNILREAVNGKLVLKINYSGKDRIIEPHAYGLSAKGEGIVRAWQEGEGWKLFTVSKMTLDAANNNLLVTFLRPREGYKLNDSAMTTIYAQVAA